MQNIEVPTLAEWTAEAPYKLGLSSGFFKLFAHMGVVEALCESGLPPSETSGSSSGGLVSALYAARLEPSQMFSKLIDLKRKDFWDLSLGFGLLQGELFDEKLRDILPVDNFEDCHITAHISTFDIYSRRTDVVRRGDIARAIRASCAFPGLFQPVIIDGRPKLDGGIRDHAGIAGFVSEDRILHVGFDHKDSLLSGFVDMAMLRLSGIVSVTPFSLQRGSEAFRQAHDATMAALARPVRMN